MNFHYIDQIPSTHNALKSGEISLPPLTMLIAREQTAGRGQRGNRWEAAPGENLTFSFILSPVDINPSRQFLISEAFALAFVDLLADFGLTAKIKWPNDIYVGDKKICGILIDHSLVGSTIQHSILSAGLNVNQTRFLSDAPNPTSIILEIKNTSNCPLAGPDCSPDKVRSPKNPKFDIQNIASRLAHKIDSRLDTLLQKKETPHEEFMQHLYRADGGYYSFHDNLLDEDISAKITAVAPDGLITLTLEDDSRRDYRFKEITFLQ